MEGNWRPPQAQGDASMAPSAGDWKSQLPLVARQRIVNKIMETLKRHLPVSVPENLNYLRKIAVRFEERTYTAAASQSDYLRKISVKMLSMELWTPTSAPIHHPTTSNASALIQNSTNAGVPVNDPVTVSSDSNLNHSNKQQHIAANRSINNRERHLNGEDDSGTKRAKLSEPVTEKAVRLEPTFSCPICMYTLVSSWSTRCGHIFCEFCIKTALEKQKKCPTCRTKLTGKDSIHRVYLPTAD